MDPQNFESRTCVSTKCVESFLKILWIHNPGNRKIVDPQNFTSKFCGSTKMQKIEITALMHLDWEKRPRGSPRIFFWGLGFGLIFFLMSLGLISRNLLGYKRTHRCDDFHVFSTPKKSIDLKKQFLFLNRLRSQTCFNCTGIDQ